VEYGGAWESYCFAHERTLEGTLAYSISHFRSFEDLKRNIEIGVRAPFVRFSTKDCAYLDGYCVLFLRKNPCKVQPNIFNNRLARNSRESGLVSLALASTILPFFNQDRYAEPLSCIFPPTRGIHLINSYIII
jgi:hypothetical protein